MVSAQRQGPRTEPEEVEEAAGLGVEHRRPGEGVSQRPGTDGRTSHKEATRNPDKCLGGTLVGRPPGAGLRVKSTMGKQSKSYTQRPPDPAPKRMENTRPHKHLHTSVIHKSRTVEATRMPIRDPRNRSIHTTACNSALKGMKS